MQLIKDFSDIQKIVVLLNSDNQEKLLVEINSLLVNYINEQNKPSLSPVVHEQDKPSLEPASNDLNNPLANFINEQQNDWNSENNFLNDMEKPTLGPISTEKNNPLEKFINEQQNDRNPENNFSKDMEKPALNPIALENSRPPLNNVTAESLAINPFTDFQAGSTNKSATPVVPTAEGINALKSSFAKSSNFPPPPPPLPNLPSQPVPAGRPIAAGNFNLKSSFGNKGSSNKTVSLSIIDFIGYIIPILTDEGKEVFRNPSTPTDIYQFLKSVNGELNLKNIHMLVFPELLTGKYLEKVHALSRERCLNFRKSSGFPTDADIQIRVGDLLISMGIIDEGNLEKALQVQKEPPKLSVTNNVEVPSWIEKTKSMIQQEAPGSSQPVKKKLIGDTLVELGMVTKDQLIYVLSVQRWLRNLIEHY